MELSNISNRRCARRPGWARRAAVFHLCASAVLLLLAAGLAAQPTPAWKAGVSRVDITPEGPIWLAGYAARTRPSEGVAHRIFAKALALEAQAGDLLVLITADLITIPRGVAEEVAGRLRDRFKIPRERILLAASHSHSSPVVEDRLLGMYQLPEVERKKVAAYTRSVEQALFQAAVQAIEHRSPTTLSFGHGRAAFAKNRRALRPDDPVDHDVPVLAVEFSSGEGGEPPRRAVVFAYACHNTTLNGYEVCGDYAGFAQGRLEEAHPGLTALFASGCGGDSNPDPRRSMELAQAHGKELADAVSAVLAGELAAVSPSALAAFDHAHLPLEAVPTRSELEKRLSDANVYERIRGRRLLDQLDSGQGIADAYALPVQVWRLGEGPAGRLLIVAIAGEVVVDYAIRLKRELGERGTMVLSYTNDCPGYIPSERVLREGGYEGGGAMVYYGLHGPWKPGVEDRVIARVHDLVRRTEGR